MITIHVIINEQHQLLEKQKELMEQMFPKEFYQFAFVKVPAEGWTIKQQRNKMKELDGFVLFISPIPYMIAELSKCSAINSNQIPIFTISKVEEVYVMCNDQREKVELPNGKIIHKVAQEGWYIA